MKSVAWAQAPASPRNLDGFLRVASASSPLLADYAGQVRQTRLDSLRRVAQQRPQLTGTAAIMAAPTVRGVGYDEAVSNGGNYAAVVTATQPLFNRPVLQNDFRILESQGQVLRNSGRLAALDLRRSITDQFLTAYTAQQQWTFSRSLLRQLRQQDEVLRQLVNGGIFKQTQYLTYYLSLRSQEVGVQQDQLVYRRELGILRYLSGVADTAFILLETPTPPTHRPLAGLSAVAQRQYTLDSLRLQLDRRAIDFGYRPQVSWVVDAGMQSASPTPLRLARSVGMSAGLMLTVPVFDGHQRQIAYDRLKVAEEIRQGYRRFLTVQRRQQYDQLEGLVRASNQLNATLRQQLAVAETLVKAGRQQLASGDISIIDYLQLVNSYRAFQFNLTQAETERLRNLYALDYLGE
ncbi:TolC family protein [Hymenobacter sp. BT730]|uniref:TolC family protein n=1 Tax=Hymenobacter sp. BT730 TaxID=3063332 RepID=UPI0026E01B30|nr:TolC family protein [Hymenobacter sp. BT730]